MQVKGFRTVNFEIGPWFLFIYNPTKKV